VITPEAIYFTLVAFFLCAMVVVAVPLFACIWREGGCVDRRRRHRAD
jgi:hypothetical protein